MFDGGVPEQLRHFIASPPPSAPPHLPLQPPPPARTLPLPLSFLSFDTHHHFLNPILHQQPQLISHKIDDREIKEGNTGLVGPVNHHHRLDHGVDHDNDAAADDDDGYHHRPWSSDEVLSLLKIRSTMESWFPEFTWEHVSRKLTEVGFKRTPQECKEKFEEEESKYLNNHNNINNYSNKSNFRMFSELEELYHHGHHNHHHHHHHHHHENPHDVNVSCDNENNNNKTLEEPTSQENDKMGQGLEEDPREEQDVGISPSEGNEGNVEKERSPPRNKKKKRGRDRFEMFKGFCEGFVKHLIAEQEEMHKKLLEDMMKRDEEKIAREEAWKKQEMERIKEELEIRAHEQAIASDRNATIIKFISKFTSLNEDQLVNKVQSPSTATATSSTTQSSSSLILPKNPTTLTCHSTKRQSKLSTFPINEHSSSTPKALTSSSQNLTPQNPNSLPTQDKPLLPISVPMHKTDTQNLKLLTNDEKDDLGKRWPRDEVLALVNIRCSLYNNGDHQDDNNKEGSATKSISLWERISQKMLESGYKRNAKRCKEKWENINKYFRKTKDVNKKRALASRTCPYFHQLSALYSQGSLAAPAGGGGSDNLESGADENRVESLKDGSPDSKPCM